MTRSPSEGEGPTDDPYEGDDLLRERVERALAAHHVAELPERDRAALRDHLILLLTTHPAMARMMGRLRERAAVDRSADLPKEAEGRPDEAIRKRRSR